MSLQELIDTLDAFRDEYNTSKDPYVQKMCRYIDNTIAGLNLYYNFFKNSKSAIENNQQTLTDALDTIDKLMPEAESDGNQLP